MHIVVPRNGQYKEPKAEWTIMNHAENTLLLLEDLHHVGLP